MYTPALPSELWQSIFELTTDDEAILRHEFPMAMACSEWFRQIYGPWILRSPQEVLNSLQRKGYATKKASESAWLSLGYLRLMPRALRRLC